MTLSNLSVQCIIAGSTALALSIVIIAAESLEVVSAYKSNSEYYLSRIDSHYKNLAILVAVALISTLKIVGIKTRRAFLIVPWLLAAIGVMGFTFYAMAYNMITLPFAHFEFAFYWIAIIGLEILITYPLCKIFGEIRHEKAKEKQTSDKNTFVKV